jgi:DnaJ-class molecular chaperone
MSQVLQKRIVEVGYKRLSAELHPDNPKTGSAEAFKDLTAAHETLLKLLKSDEGTSSAADRPATDSNGQQQRTTGRRQQPAGTIFLSPENLWGMVHGQSIPITGPDGQLMCYCSLDKQQATDLLTQGILSGASRLFDVFTRRK